jgi:NADH:ubiquinone oxidoreductase subunit 6 (subunit J)
MIDAIFYVLSGVVIVSGFLALTLRNLFHCALFLALAMFGISGIFLYLNAEFLAAVQVLIYVGAVTVLIIFGIMLTRNVMDERTRVMNQQAVLAVAAALAVGFILFQVIGQSAFTRSEHPTAGMETSAAGEKATQLPAVPEAISEVYSLGIELLRVDRGFAFAFEFVSILLLAALVGAVVIARKDPA